MNIFFNLQLRDHVDLVDGRCADFPRPPLITLLSSKPAGTGAEDGPNQSLIRC